MAHFSRRRHIRKSDAASRGSLASLVRPFAVGALSTATAILTTVALTERAAAETWNTNGGLWGTAGNWTPATVPNAIDATATFNAITPGNSFGVGLGGGPFTVGTLNLNSAVVSSGYSLESGTLIMQVSAGAAAINVQTNNLVPDFLNTATLQLNSNTVVTTASSAASLNVEGLVTGAGALTIAGPGTVILNNANTYAGGTTISGGTLAVTDDANLGQVAGVLTFNGGTLRTSTNGGLDVGLDRPITLQAPGGTVETDINTVLAGNIGGTGGLTKTGFAILSISGITSYAGATNVVAGILQADSSGELSAASAFTISAGATLELRGDHSIGSLAGAGEVRNFLAAGLTTGFDNTSTTFSGIISGAAPFSLVKVGSGTQTLSGINTYVGTTTVNGGTLAVDGSIASSSLTTVNSGGTLGGNGIVGNTVINAGGTLAPGNSIGLLTVQGSLVFAAASSYLVEVSPASVDRVNVTGAATLGGATVTANFAAGAYVAKQYTILNAAGGVSGTFSGPVNTNLPSGFNSSLSYDANNAYLNLALNFVPPPGTGLNVNQQNVANTLVNFFNTTGGIPIVFGGLTAAGLTQISGETATGSQQTTFNAMNQFMGVMTDPFIAGRGDPISAGGNPNAYAEDGSLAYAARRKPNDALAAIYTKAPPLVQSFAQRWSVWAAGFGGSQTTSGDPTALGSNNTRASLAAGAVGADYRISPNTLAGFALAGGGTNFSINGFGSGGSDLFQAGAFIRHNVGPAYITGALAYGWQDVTTDRTVTVAGIDRLRAQFNANAWSGRAEGGYRFASHGFGWTPYAAGQFTTLELPAYAEQAIVGTNTFALAYGAKSVTATRSELGLRTDRSFAVENGIFTLRSRAAWAHDFNPDRTISATFQTLPGASFVVNGARQAADAALVTGTTEMKWLNGWSTAATFEGEFSNVTRSYAGKGVVRYEW